MSLSNLHRDLSLKCIMCAKRFELYSSFYNIFDNKIHGVKIHKVMSNMFTNAKFTRGATISELIFQCCFKYVERMEQRYVKVINFFRMVEMVELVDELQNRLPHLRTRNDFPYFLSFTASQSTSSEPSTIVNRNECNEDNSDNCATSSKSSTIVNMIEYNEDNSDNYSISSEPSTIFNGNECNEDNSDNYSISSEPSTIFNGNECNEDNSDNCATSSKSSTIVYGIEYNEDNSDNYSISSEPSTIFNGNECNEDNSDNCATSSKSSTIVYGIEYNEDNSDNCSTSSEPSTIVNRNECNEDNSDNYSISSEPSTIFNGNECNEDNSDNCATSSKSSTIVNGIEYNEDNSDNCSTSSEPSTIVTGYEYNENNSNMLNSTYNTCINIMSDSVYSKSGAFYSCIIPLIPLIPSCRLFFKNFYQFKIHYRRHRNVNGMVCWTYNKIFSDRSKMRKHKHKDSCRFPGRFVCVLCNESFNDIQSKSYHKYITHIKN